MQIPFVESLGNSKKGDETTPCSPAEHALYRSGVGALVWLLYTRPDLYALVSTLQSKGHAPTRSGLRKLNKVIEEAKDSKVGFDLRGLSSRS